ncbi:MAG: DUF1302 family protein [Aromatoleum sp.]|jgi:hypothetical protein|uniref:DUF1302 domain-containing protein n=1 Tax=Aromatoleum sp. TaxID=2307007 RepID=UPI0028949E42|nr:DUF1302 family protein [Aromatoleum sp.]MDT3671023.1 DUF1302 family protein [Aromatoleum sp.]
MKTNKGARTSPRPRTAGLIGSAVVALFATPAGAIEIDTGNPDLAIRWDNTIKYNAGWRAEGRNNTLGDNWISQATNHGWDKGDMVTNRLDILTEFDFVFKQDHGFRVSATAWKDFAFDRHVDGHPAYQAAGLGTAYPNNRFTDNVERWYDQSGEILDAFVFTKLDLGPVPVNIRAGRHNVYWGESLFTFSDSIAYGQGPLDLRKATSTPGIEAKELFLPQNQISVGAQITDDISVAANYYLEWDPHRLPEGGTYLGGADLSFLGGTSAAPHNGFPAVGDLDHGPNKKPDDRGSFGVMAKVKSDLLGGDVGFYYRKFDDRYPMMIAGNGFLHNAYAEDVKLYGVSLSRLIGAVSVGAEISRRENTALKSTAAGVARGDTWHALANAVAYFGKTAVFDSAPLTVELSYAKLDDVKRGSRSFFNHENYGCVGGTDAGCATDESVGFNLAFTPTWFQVFPGIDLTMPINYSRGLYGNSPTVLGPGKDSGAWSVGLSADVHAKYVVTLAYNDYYGPYSKGPNAFAVPGVSPVVWQGTNGSGVLSDRGWVSLTLKTTF